MGNFRCITCAIPSIQVNVWNTNMYKQRKFYPRKCHEGTVGGGGVEVQLYSFFNLGARWRWVVNATPHYFTPGKDPVPIVQEAGWAPGPVRTAAENLAVTGIRSSHRPARRESLYRLSYPGPQYNWLSLFINTSWNLLYIKKRCPNRFDVECLVIYIRGLFKKYPTFGREKYSYTPGGLQL
jgi:hypothetical protein